MSMILPEGGYQPQPKPDPALPRNGRSKAGKPIPLRVRQAVAERSGFVCELGCGRRAVHMHHRKLRSQGGQHTPANLLHTCMQHHDEIHANPERAYCLGWLVRGWASPEDVPFTPDPSMPIIPIPTGVTA